MNKRIACKIYINTLFKTIQKVSDGRYCRRKPAKHIAEEAGQLLPRASTMSELYSEDVW